MSGFTCSGCRGSFLFSTFDMFVTLLGSTFEGEVGADHGLFAKFALVILVAFGIGSDLLNRLDLVASSCGLANTSSSVVSELVKDSESVVGCSLSGLFWLGEYVGSSCSSSVLSLKKSWLTGE